MERLRDSYSSLEQLSSSPVTLNRPVSIGIIRNRKWMDGWIVLYYNRLTTVNVLFKAVKSWVRPNESQEHNKQYRFSTCDQSLQTYSQLCWLKLLIITIYQSSCTSWVVLSCFLWVAFLYFCLSQTYVDQAHHVVSIFSFSNNMTHIFIFMTWIDQSRGLAPSRSFLWLHFTKNKLYY